MRPGVYPCSDAEPHAASVPAWVRPDGVCPAFRWIGQPFSSCEQCGQPFWEHTHEVGPAEGSGIFSVRERHVFVPPALRQRVRAKWSRAVS